MCKPVAMVAFSIFQADMSASAAGLFEMLEADIASVARELGALRGMVALT